MFSVRWVRSALGDLTDLWLQADSTERLAITAATNEIDGQLRSDPEHAGESRFGDRRIVIVPPLAVILKVSVDDRLVMILKVWRFKTREQNQ